MDQDLFALSSHALHPAFGCGSRKKKQYPGNSQGAPSCRIKNDTTLLVMFSVSRAVNHGQYSVLCHKRNLVAKRKMKLVCRKKNLKTQSMIPMRLSPCPFKGFTEIIRLRPGV